jgi:hypothetical protein
MQMTGQPDAALGGLMMQNIGADIDRALATPPPAEGDPRPWPANFGHRRPRMTRAEAKELHARIQALLAEVEAAGAARAESGDEAAEAGAPVFRYDVFWVAAAAEEDAPAGE